MAYSCAGFELVQIMNQTETILFWYDIIRFIGIVGAVLALIVYNFYMSHVFILITWILIVFGIAFLFIKFEFHSGTSTVFCVLFTAFLLASRPNDMINIVAKYVCIFTLFITFIIKIGKRCL